MSAMANVFPRNRALINLLGISLLAILCVSCTSIDMEQRLPEEHMRSLQAQFTGIMTIGADEAASGAYLFGRPVQVQADSRGNVYVADENVLGIKVYDSGGRFLRTLGRSGEGPGEFERLTSLHINQQDEIVVADARNQRITTFSPEGDVLSTVPVRSDETLSVPKMMAQLDTSRYVFLYQLSRFSSADDRHLLHVVSMGSSIEKDTCFLPAGEVYRGPTVSAQRFSETMPGSFQFAGPDHIIYAPWLYTGEIYRYSYDRTRGEWVGKQPIKGLQRRETP